MARSWHHRYRRIIDAYRTKLMEVDPRACETVDDKLWAMGEEWVADRRELDLDAFMTASEMARRFGLNAYDIRNWATRHPALIPKHRVGAKTLFRVRDVLKYQAGVCDG